MGRFENWHQRWCVLDHEGALAELPDELAARGSKRCLLVLSRTLDRTGTLADTVASLIGSRLVGRYTQVEAHVPRQSALRLARVMEELSIDTVVTLGGGSVTDSAKAACLARDHGCTTVDDFDALRRDPAFGLMTAERRSTVLVCLPTTLAGAEFSNTAGITDETLGHKHLYSYDHLAPDLVVLDPQLAAETPPRLWHASGIKILSDAIEQVSGRDRHDVVSTLGLAAIGRIARNLPREHSPEAALECFRGVWLSMFGVFSAQVFPGIGASLRHQLGAATGAPHGDLAAVLLPHVLRYNETAIADVLPVINTALDGLLDRLDVARRLRDLDVPREALGPVAEAAAGSFAGRNNPRAASAAQLRELLEDAY
ncbi:iron-containing alcohol dehydrogenase [Amycolatopsis jejuensis]|uniref:iron-containing alcohol dehydrogenase n=1 Tax=Amycolatopsis jejuensis TaxID=330084 RepID=UPI000526E669|nr:iron-containing alcohol dehydrogenase [Amycolatopsis jejuensis]